MKTNRYWTVSIMVTAIAAIMLFNVAIFTPPAAGQKGYSIADLGQWDPINAVEVKGDYAYLGVDYRRLRIVDISNPLAPVIVSETEDLVEPGGGADIPGVEVSGTYAYVAAGKGGLQIVDVSDPLQPHVVGRKRFLCARDVTSNGFNLVVAWNHCGDEHVGAVSIYDISDPIHPVDVGSAFNASYSDLSRSIVAIAGDYVYAAVANGSVLDIIPINDPSAHIVFYDWPDGIHFTPESLVASDHYLYVSGIVYNAPPLIAVFDISDPVEPVWVNSFDAHANSMVVDDEKLYALTTVYSLTDPVNPSFMFKYDTKQWIRDIDTQDNCLYAGAYPSGFYVFCASDPLVTATPSPTASVGETLYLPLIRSIVL